MWLYVVVPQASGAPVEYPMEMMAVQGAVKLGWKPDSVKPGGKVTLEFHPLRDGHPGGQLISIVLADGKKLAAINAAAAAPRDLNQSIIPADQWVGSTITLDQNITQWLQFKPRLIIPIAATRPIIRMCGRRSQFPQQIVFYPVGAPPGLQVSYDFKQIPNYERATELSDRYTLGFTIKLPCEWEGRLNYANGDEEVRRNEVSNLRLINTNNVSAALGCHSGFASHAGFSRCSDLDKTREPALSESVL